MALLAGGFPNNAEFVHVQGARKKTNETSTQMTRHQALALEHTMEAVF